MVLSRKNKRQTLQYAIIKIYLFKKEKEDLVHLLNTGANGIRANRSITQRA